MFPDGLALQIGGLEEPEAVDPPDLPGDARGKPSHALGVDVADLQAEDPRNVVSLGRGDTEQRSRSRIDVASTEATQR
jgi:hypothetical protein